MSVPLIYYYSGLPSLLSLRDYYSKQLNFVVVVVVVG